MGGGHFESQRIPWQGSFAGLPSVEICAAVERQLQLQNHVDYSGPSVTRLQLEPLSLVLQHWEQGVLVAAARKIMDLLNVYIEVS